jgi:Abnormal spindle-like microcephaly-assoc'd, ASPM-SPD-2-Hydin
MHTRGDTFFRIQGPRIGRFGPNFKGINATLVLALVASIMSVCLSSMGAKHSISVTPTAINFGTQPLNTTANSTITVTNSGSHTLEIESVSLSGSSAFTLTGWTGELSLTPSQSFQLGVTFDPTAQGNYSATLTIHINRSDDPVVTITGVGSAPIVSISPATAVVTAGNSQQFTATVTNSTSTSVNWMVNGTQGGNSTVGIISGSGLYTAPSNVSSSSSVTVTAADETSQANASVTIMPAPTPVTVSVSPTSASVQVGLTQQFTATVSGTTNTAVNWLVSGIASGNSTVGTISSTGLYTAPSTVPTSAVTVTAQSAYQSTSSANATVTITPLNFVDLSWTASTSTVSGYNIYRATVSGGPYTIINPSLQSGTTYTDSTVQAGQTYYYVTTAVNSSGVESAYSNQVSAAIP